MAKNIYQDRDLKQILESSIKAKERLRELVAPICQRVAKSFLDLYGIEAFTTYDIELELQELSEYRELQYGRRGLTEIIRACGWELTSIRPPLPCRMSVKAWKRVDEP